MMDKEPEIEWFLRVQVELSSAGWLHLARSVQRVNSRPICSCLGHRSWHWWWQPPSGSCSWRWWSCVACWQPSDAQTSNIWKTTEWTDREREERQAAAVLLLINARSLALTTNKTTNIDRKLKEQKSKVSIKAKQNLQDWFHSNGLKWGWSRCDEWWYY